jgi:hypothetical protein
LNVLLLLLPCLLLLLALLAGRYPGEQMLERATRRRRVRRPRREPEQQARPRLPEFRKPCAGRLVASSLDSRAPPGWAVPHVARATA